MVNSGVMSLSGFMWPSGFMRLKVGKVRKSGEKWGKVAKSGEKWEKLVKNGEKWRKVGKNGEKWEKLPGKLGQLCAH